MALNAIRSFVLAALLALLPVSAWAQSGSTLATDWARWWNELSKPPEPVATLSLGEPGAPNHLLAGGLAGAVLGGAALNSFTETPHQSFHVTNEGWFGRNTYAGGADKASHFVDYQFLPKELGNFYEVLGYSRGESIAMGAAVAVAAGLVTEFGDGTTFWGFSFEDLTMDVLGAGTGALIAATRTGDLFGFRRGFVPDSGGGPCCLSGRGHRDYSNEIYSADLKLGGVADRGRLAIGPLRYLLFSVTYGSSGYSGLDPSRRERLVGFEIGLNFEAILDGVGVRRDTWWGYALHVVLDNMRIPFTAVGARYDLNRGKWRAVP